MDPEQTQDAADDQNGGGRWKAICTEGDGELNEDWVSFGEAVQTKNAHAAATGHSTDLING